MVDTNALLALAFTLVSNFTQIVTVPSFAVPRTTNDLESYVIGSPNRSIDVYLVHKRGTEFWIRNGVVGAYRNPGSFYDAQDPDLLPRFTGTPVMSSNEAVRFATDTINRLTRTNNPIAGLVPTVRSPGLTSVGLVPFYKIHWLIKQFPAFRYDAEVEVDARKKQITKISLDAPEFRGPAMAQAISNQVYTPDPRVLSSVTPVTKGERIAPYPTTNEVEHGIQQWLALCQKLDLDPGGQTNLSQVDWERCAVYTNELYSAMARVIQIRFRNGACFEAIDGIVFEHFGEDACFTGFWGDRPRAEWAPFEGKVLLKWEDRAKDFEGFVSHRLGIPIATIRALSPAPITHPADVVSEGRARILVRWLEWPKDQSQLTELESIPHKISCEFDLRDGKVKWVGFHPSLLGWRDRQPGR